MIRNTLKHFFLASSLFVVSLLVVSIGCGDPAVIRPGGDTKKPADNNPSNPDVGFVEDTSSDEPMVDPMIREARETLIAARCEMIFRCCSSGERESKFNMTADQADCEENAGAAPFSLDMVVATEAHREGRITFNGGMATLCAEEFTAQDCSDWTTDQPSKTDLPGCVDIMAPGLEEGAPCGFDVECKSGYCITGFGDQVCGKTAQAGESCDGTPCAPDAYCQTFSMICAQKLANGATCLRSQECMSGHCVESGDAGLVCASTPTFCEG